MNETNAGNHFDTGKLKWSLFPIHPIVLVIKVLMFGAGKYDDDNWKKGINYSDLYNSSKRHIEVWFYEREEKDEESKIHPLAHAICDLTFLLFYEIFKEKYKAFDNRPSFDASISQEALIYTPQNKVDEIKTCN